MNVSFPPLQKWNNTCTYIYSCIYTHTHIYICVYFLCARKIDTYDMITINHMTDKKQRNKQSNKQTKKLFFFFFKIPFLSTVSCCCFMPFFFFDFFFSLHNREVLTSDFRYVTLLRQFKFEISPNIIMSHQRLWTQLLLKSW